jgi:hypothetical protein
VNRKRVIIALTILALFCFGEFQKRNNDMIINFLTKSYLYIKSNQTINNKQYDIKLPFPEWVVFDEHKDTYYLIYDNIISAYIDKIICPINFNYELLSELCEGLTSIDKKYANIEGTETQCLNSQTHNEIYFLSNDGYFILKLIINDPNKEYEKPLGLLLNAIKKKNNV